MFLGQFPPMLPASAVTGNAQLHEQVNPAGKLYFLIQLAKLYFSAFVGFNFIYNVYLILLGGALLNKFCLPKIAGEL